MFQRLPCFCDSIHQAVSAAVIRWLLKHATLQDAAQKIIPAAAQILIQTNSVIPCPSATSQGQCHFPCYLCACLFRLIFCCALSCFLWLASGEFLLLPDFPAAEYKDHPRCYTMLLKFIELDRNRQADENDQPVAYHTLYSWYMMVEKKQIGSDLRNAQVPFVQAWIDAHGIHLTCLCPFSFVGSHGALDSPLPSLVRFKNKWNTSVILVGSNCRNSKYSVFRRLFFAVSSAVPVSVRTSASCVFVPRQPPKRKFSF